MALIETAAKPLLHVHLEGSIPAASALDLSRKYDIALPFAGDGRKIADTMKPRDWSHFRSVFGILCSLLREPSDFTSALLALRRKLAVDRVDYVEVHCTPWKHMTRGISLDILGDALAAGATNGTAELPVTQIILDLTRNPAEPADLIVEWLLSAPRTSFVGLGFSGGPDALPRRRFAKLSQRARDAGFGVVVHAGELEGVASVKEAVNYLTPHRLAHGVTVLEDMKYAVELANSGMHLEICPTANRRMGVGSPDGSHVRQLLDLGFEISLNTDDEFLFDTSLPNEIGILLNSGVITAKEVALSFDAARKVAFKAP